jgi:Cu2+-exporting ATPase
MRETVDLSHYVTLAPDGAARIELAVEGIDCAGCINRIEQAIKRLAGVREARLNFTTHRLSVAWDPQLCAPAAILDRLSSLGHRAHPFRMVPAEDEERRREQWLLRCLAVAGFAAMNIMLLSVSVWSGNASDITPETRDLFHWLSALIALPAAAYAGQPFFRSAVTAIRAGRLNMDVPISLGVLLALGMSVYETAIHAEHAYFDSAVMLLFFLLAGRFLEQAMRRRTRAVAGNLAALRATVAHRLEAGEQLVSVPVEALRLGDRILVRPGDRVPADGVVVSGDAEIDESLVTGETARRRTEAGQTVYAGSTTFDGALTVEVTAVGGGTLLDEVERLLEKATAAKSRYVRLADRAARLYAPMVHTTAAATAIGWLLLGASLHDSLITAIAVLIITCPCALALAVPAVQVVAAGALFRSGVLLNSAEAIERLAEADTIAFDKTGTLTLPEPGISNPHTVPPETLELAARLALSSRHPLAAALAREAGERRPLAAAEEIAGQGVRAVVDGVETCVGSPAFCGATELAGKVAAEDPEASLIAFAHGEQRAIFAVRQQLRPDARQVVGELAARGYRLAILSGDRRHAVEAMAAALGVATWHAEMKPADKIAAIETLRSTGAQVLMVGDGLNDAAALAAAHVSMSPVSGAEITQAHADTLFVGDRLLPVARALAVAARARRLMRQNLLLAVVYNMIAVPVAVAGLVTPLIAAAAMSGSSILVTLNALRAGLGSRTMRPPAAAPTRLMHWAETQQG